MAARVSRRAWWVFAAASAAYFMAIMHRTALGVAGVDALDRFAIGATALSALSMTQIAAYAILQVPSGRLLDRFGPRTVMVAGSLLMAIGQVLMATTESFTWAIVARVLIGAGDAPIFISASRLVAHWFPPRRAPQMVQLTAQVGQAGQLATAIPVAWLLHAQGWSTTFLVLAGLGIVAAVVVSGVRTPGAADADDVPAVAVAQSRPTVSKAGVRLGFWTHFTALFSANTVALLWGVPFFVTAQGRSVAEASLLLTALTLSKFVVSPFVGTATARHPFRRSWMVLMFACVTAVAWALLLIPSTPRPMWQLVLFVMAIAAGGPVSLVGLDYARTFADHSRLGAANGLVNTGGFVSTIVAVGLVGAVLQLAAPDGNYDLDAYRLAFAALALPWAVGVVGIVRNRAKARADWAANGVLVPPLREVLERRRSGRRGD
ncbi:MFS transporter [Demequina sp. TTPB684]|uniref:MFS transporter n=1 Tax=unclassified Demequina TaxID=2620311 RepID=UPI001CF427EF|nr:MULTISPECIES: MFS transporter [unclassified Demequina]MCB2411395.1 MFS transporter [Demequina sp. TTPB684]UPU87591.1 MFS transporter [Demequina sp. TMPB413]